MEKGVKDETHTKYLPYQKENTSNRLEDNKGNKKRRN